MRESGLDPAVSAGPAGYKIEFLYPTTDRAERVSLERYVHDYDHRKPATTRDAFRRLVKRVKSGKTPGILVHSPRVLGSSVAHFQHAKATVEKAGGVLRVLADFDGPLVASILRRPAIDALLGRVFAGGTVSIGPESMALEEDGYFHHTVFIDEDGRALITLRPEPTPDALAHEVMHVEMHREGYPMFVVPEAGSDFTSTLLDVEVDRRVMELGIDSASVTDGHMRTRLPNLVHYSEVERLDEYIMRAMLPTRDVSLRTRYLEGIRALSPSIASRGDQVIEICEGGDALRSAAGAQAAFASVADLLNDWGFACRPCVPVEQRWLDR